MTEELERTEIEYTHTYDQFTVLAMIRLAGYLLRLVRKNIPSNSAAALAQERLNTV